MREIKFRAWCPLTKGMYVVWNLFEHDVNGAFIKKDDVLGEVVEIMQYTGLKTVDGKEIYEGDILQWEPYSERGGAAKQGIVQWNERIVGFELSTDNLHCVVDEYCPLIIGSIYESPELLEEQSGGE